MRRCLLIIVICLLFVMPAAGGDYSGVPVKLGGLDVVVWSPQTSGPAPKPVIIFSHGFRSRATQSRFLMEALAAHGYLVFAPSHRDARDQRGGAVGPAKPEERFRKPEAWSDKNYQDRAQDVRQLLAAIQTDERFRDQANLRQLGLVGHSLGGYTVLGLGGAWPAWKLEGVKAVLALSPYSQPFVAHHTLGDLAAPVMYQGGTLDFGITPTLHKSQGAYDQTPPPKYCVELAGAGHLAWSDLRPAAHEVIIAYSLAFLDHYVRGLPAAAVLTRARPGVASLRFASELGTGDTGPHKGRRRSWRQRLQPRPGE